MRCDGATGGGVGVVLKMTRGPQVLNDGPTRMSSVLGLLDRW